MAQPVGQMKATASTVRTSRPKPATVDPDQSTVPRWAQVGHSSGVRSEHVRALRSSALNGSERWRHVVHERVLSGVLSSSLAPSSPTSRSRRSWTTSSSASWRSCRSPRRGSPSSGRSTTPTTSPRPTRRRCVSSGCSPSSGRARACTRTPPVSWWPSRTWRPTRCSRCSPRRPEQRCSPSSCATPLGAWVPWTCTGTPGSGPGGSPPTRTPGCPPPDPPGSLCPSGADPAVHADATPRNCGEPSVGPLPKACGAQHIKRPAYWADRSPGSP